MPRKPLSAPVRDELMQRLSSGINIVDIAYDMGLGVRTVYAYASGDRDHLLSAEQVRVRAQAWSTYRYWVR